MPRRPRRRSTRPADGAFPAAAPLPELGVLVPLAPEDFPSPAAYLCAWQAQRAHEVRQLMTLALSAPPLPVPPPDPNAGVAEADAADAADRVSEPTRTRFRAELRARALAKRHGIASPGGWPGVVPGPGPGGISLHSFAPAGRDGGRLAPWYDELPVAAGAGLEGWDAGCEQWVELPPGLPGGRHAALTVRGASMQPLLADGDLVLVRLDATPRPGRVAVARRSDGGYEAGYVVKRVRAVRGGAVALESLNPAYGPLAVPDDGRHVLGTVVARWARDGWAGDGPGG